ncbi:MAG: sugar kinase [Pseudomonadota bacterium]
MTFGDGDIIAIGECMVELSRTADGTFALAQAGDTFNTAVYISRLSDRDVRYATAIGDDIYSDGIVARAQSEGIATDLIARVPGRMPGLYLIETENGERTFSYWRETAAARDYLNRADIAQLSAAFAAASVVYLSGITLSIYDDASRARLADLIDAARRAGTRVAMDSNFRPRGWPGDRAKTRAIYQQFWERVDIALPTFDDEQALWDETAPEETIARLHGCGVSEIAVKVGADGCLVSTLGTAEHRAARVPVNNIVTPVDTTAAGDSFNAAYIAARVRGDAPELAAVWAHRMAACVISHRGGVIPQAATAGVVGAFRAGNKPPLPPS